jgi:hypothetical protein
VILGKFWSRFDLQQRRNRKFLGDDQGCLSKQTVRLPMKAIDSTYRSRGFKRKGDRVLSYNIIVVPNQRYGLKRCSGTFGSILVTLVRYTDPGGKNTVFFCPPPYKFKKSPYEQVLYGDWLGRPAG